MRYPILLFVVAVCCPLNAVQAVEILTAEELAAHCEVLPDGTDTADGQYCIRYIQGFIDGAIATDVRVMLNVEAELARKESFSERAMRVRSRGNAQRAARYAEFCLGDPIELREIVDKIVADLEGRQQLVPELTARQFVYRSLRKHYPCKTRD